jgi:hypothetical protein
MCAFEQINGIALKKQTTVGFEEDFLGSTVGAPTGQSNPLPEKLRHDVSWA